MAYASQLLQRKIFFHSHAVQQSPPLYIELSYRQTDTEFISVLNNLRNNQITAADVQALNKYVKPDFDLKTTGYITLTTHNKADAMNAQALEDLKGS
jgi:hypothetical protein